MTLYLEASPGHFDRFTGQPIGNIVWPPTIESVWTTGELAERGLFVPQPADAIPNGKRSLGTTVQRVGGVVKFVHTLEDIPEPVPADFPLSMRQLRLGLLASGFPVGFIQNTIDAIGDTTQRAIAQIWYDETSVVQWDHPMTQSLIAAAGITEAQAIAMWLAAKDLAA